MSVDWDSRSIGVSTKKDWEEYREYLVEENSEWDKDCLDKESIEFIEHYNDDGDGGSNSEESYLELT